MSSVFFCSGYSEPSPWGWLSLTDLIFFFWCLFYLSLFSRQRVPIFVTAFSHFPSDLDVQSEPTAFEGSSFPFFFNFSCFPLMFSELNDLLSVCAVPYHFFLFFETSSGPFLVADSDWCSFMPSFSSSWSCELLLRCWPIHLVLRHRALVESVCPLLFVSSLPFFSMMWFSMAPLLPVPCSLILDIYQVESDSYGTWIPITFSSLVFSLTDQMCFRKRTPVSTLRF